MFNPTAFNTQELVLRDSVISGLNSSLSIPKVLEATRASLLEFVQADAMALCLMHTEPFDFQWLVPGFPIRLLDDYAVLAEHDFLRAPILARPNVPVRDTQLLTREEYERTLIFQRSRELDLTLEHIMAVLLPIGPGLVGALAFYRNKRRPFSLENTTAVASINEHLMNTVRNCNDAQGLMAGAHLLEELHRRPDSAYLVVEPPSRVEFRSEHANALLARWFTGADLHSCGLPLVFKERLDALVRMDADARLGKTLWVFNHPEGNRTCRFIEMPAADGPRRWALRLNEIPHSIPLPWEMERQLTPRQATIARHLLCNRNNEQIAVELGRKLLTVKTHVRNIFDKLGVDSRADLLYQAARLNKPV
ncbi:helix-turn-helix transcriptional regulator [Corallococcus exercitus]|uniref:Response regulator transcription factor n=1 Tax=Corallococcus exercitus TaxID=2316736 RepID=A0A7Y4JMP8_9BACT|nr:LuxR C-terminal-related transcriptional regulator [Corallococcus exercitus]NOK07861.1 response regulator transcription factor [Corallococcus exercitus]